MSYEEYSAECRGKLMEALRRWRGLHAAWWFDLVLFNLCSMALMMNGSLGVRIAGDIMLVLNTAVATASIRRSRAQIRECILCLHIVNQGERAMEELRNLLRFFLSAEDDKGEEWKKS